MTTNRALLTDGCLAKTIPWILCLLFPSSLSHRLVGFGQFRWLKWWWSVNKTATTTWPSPYDRARSPSYPRASLRTAGSRGVSRWLHLRWSGCSALLCCASRMASVDCDFLSFDITWSSSTSRTGNDAFMIGVGVYARGFLMYDVLSRSNWSIAHACLCTCVCMCNFHIVSWRDLLCDIGYVLLQSQWMVLFSSGWLIFNLIVFRPLTVFFFYILWPYRIFCLYAFSKYAYFQYNTLLIFRLKMVDLPNFYRLQFETNVYTNRWMG